MIIRPCDNSDLLDLYDWRNDLVSREMSKESHFISWSEHVSWFTNKAQDTNFLILICEDNTVDKRLGMVSFNIIEKKATVSINLCPTSRGKGVAFDCLKNSLSFCFHEFPSVQIYAAEIKKNNKPSMKIFKKIGFIPIMERGDFIILEFAI